MKRRTMWIGGAAAAAIIAGGAGATFAASNSNDGESPLTGTTLERASEAALDHVGGGTVLETETGDGGAAYEVEIRTPDGRQVEVHLDEHFTVTGDEADDDGPNDDGPNDDDGPGDD
ncbi:MAG: PepSY domain-containing protein [Jiangellaceae bacterium]